MKKGGIEVGGKKIKVTVIYYDDQSDPQVSAKLTEKLITEEKVQFLLGALFERDHPRHLSDRRGNTTSSTWPVRPMRIRSIPAGTRMSFFHPPPCQRHPAQFSRYAYHI